MAAAAAKYADEIHVTSDNPRFEDPAKIIEHIIPGLKGSKVPWSKETDRKTAILSALQGMAKGEVLLILGKGHEKYQEIKGVRHDFSDFDVVREWVAGKGGR